MMDFLGMMPPTVLIPVSIPGSWEQVEFQAKQFVFNGRVLGISSRRSGNQTVATGYQCSRCKTTFFISAWDLDGLRHNCTNAVK